MALPKAYLTTTKNLSRVQPRFCGHLIKAHNGPGGCHDTEAEILSGVQA